MEAVMREDIVQMSQNELIRLHLVSEVLNRKLKQVAVAVKLGLSTRQVRRLVRRVESEGSQGLAHRLRGRPGTRRIDDKLRQKILGLYRKDYYDFGPTFACEKLFEINRIKLSDETLRQWLMAEGLWQRRRKGRKHRRWRERKHHFGEMIQMDGSHHAWFEDRGPKCVLMGYIDDSTSAKYGRFYAYEGTIPALESLRRYIERYGIPLCIYLDRHSTYKAWAEPTVDQELRGERALSQFEAAAKKLGIRIIHAQSAPAKGRIERSFKTDQDRLVKELRLQGISNMDDGNKFLETYWPRHNQRFAVPALEEADLHRPRPRDLDLDAILCIRTPHPVRNDYTIVHQGQLYQILNRDVPKWVDVEDRVDGRMYITSGQRRLDYKPINRRPPAQQPPKPPKTRREAWKPGKEHPWKKGILVPA
jgi:transposase